jgi:hypothetical protein
MKMAVTATIVLCLILGATSLFAASVDPAVLCTAVVDRACEGVETMFPAGVGKVYAHTTILDHKGSVTHRWIFKSKVMAEVELKVNGTPWRTWSAKTIDPLWSGEWKVEVVNNEDDSVMEILEFTITE